MKVAIATDGNNVSAHFGHCEGFFFYALDENGNSQKSFTPNPGHRPGFLPMFLKENDINVIIAGGMGGAAQSMFMDNDIEVFVGIQGDCDAAIQEYMSGRMKSSGSVCQDHQHEGSC
ncbi:MAG: dinitrogenase iron-molybdenum cofactor [Gracilibacter sp. BRH_c7a]|nr:MAG: dinitrogenase iron-molybdenum cofactor [Gracilibacter sp. BRH_c7a]KUO65102.1 MAG: dinitrogenase iron-molybdenum cofactor [Gracilibacter sp. BRH_c7a]